MRWTFRLGRPFVPVGGSQTRVPPPAVFIVGPGVTLTSPQADLGKLGAAGEFECSAIATRRVALREGGFAQLLQGRDAHRIYQRAHAVETCVLACGEVVVALDPRVEPPFSRRQVRSVYKFMAYKACILAASLPEWREAFAAWRDRADRLEDYRDARCLPLHVFEAAGGFPDLETAASRDVFDGECGSKAKRVDEGARVWELNPGAFHGRPPSLRIAGQSVPVGMHWDVQARGKGITTLANSIEVWKIPREDYLNVAPNAYMSNSSGRSQAARMYPPTGRKT